MRRYQIFKRYLAAPRLVGVWTLLGLEAALLIIGGYFLPTLVMVLNVVAFLGVAAYLTYGGIRQEQLTIESSLSSTELDSLVQNLKDGVVIYDQNFTVLTFNRAASEMFQLKTEDVVGKTITPALVSDPRYRAVAQVMFPSLAPAINQISESQQWPQIVALTLEDPKRNLHTTLQQITDKLGQTIGFIKVIHDRTREKSIIESKNEFIGTAAHQLRTPLTAIRWALESIAQEVTGNNPNLTDTVDGALRSSERALKITDDLLDAAKIEEGRFGYTFQDLDIIDLMRKVVAETAPIAKQHDVQMFFRASESKITVHGDPERLATAILNLLDNAIRYNVRDGKVTVTATKREGLPFLKVTVADTGVGIPKDDLGKIFQKLHRGSNVVEIEPNGNGLGLYITRNIIKRHGGDIGVDSVVNRGSTFWFTLPLDASLLPPKEFTSDEP